MNNPVIDEYGNQRWYEANWLHRIGDPAVIYADGSKLWYVNGKLHRTDGPAWIDSDGSQYWYLNGRVISNNTRFQRLAGISDEEMIAIILKYGNVCYNIPVDVN